MAARLAHLLLLLPLIALFMGAGYSARSQNFVVTAATPQLALEIAETAEKCRRDLALEWLGRELPPWSFQGRPELCPIDAMKVSPALGAGGVTSFSFHEGVPFGWTMSVTGSRERVLDSVIPHEITHTIFATHFGRPLPRWADEGACTTVEHESEKAKQDHFLVEFLTTNRGIAFNKMFAMTEYPRDILPLYSQGYSLARFLIHQGGKPKFVEYVGEGMRTRNWPAATQRFYGYRDLSVLQLTWVEWVRQGSRPLEMNNGNGNVLLASATPNQPKPRSFENAAPEDDFRSSRLSRPVTEGWESRGSIHTPVAPASAPLYRRKPADQNDNGARPDPNDVTVVEEMVPVRNAAPEEGEVLMSWSKKDDQSWVDVKGLAKDGRAPARGGYAETATSDRVFTQRRPDMQYDAPTRRSETLLR